MVTASPFTSAEPSQFFEGETRRGRPALLQVAETPEKAWQLAESIAFSEEAVGRWPAGVSGLGEPGQLEREGSGH